MRVRDRTLGCEVARPPGRPVVRLPNWWLPRHTGAARVADYVNGRYMSRGATVNIGAIATEARVSAQTVTNLDGTLTSVAAAQLGIGKGTGLQMRQAATNIVLSSINFTGQNANITLSNDGSLDAFGEPNLTKCATLAGANGLAAGAHVFGSTVAACSWVVKRGNFDTNPTWRFGLYDTTALADRGYITFDFSTGLTSVAFGTVSSHGAIPLANGCWRIWALIPVIAGNSHNLYKGGVGGPIGVGFEWYLGDAQAEDDRVTPIIRTTGTVATRAASAVTAVPDGALPFPGYNPVEGTFVIEVDADEILGVTTARALFQLGDASYANRMLLFQESGSVIKLGVGTPGFWHSGPAVSLNQSAFAGVHRVAAAYAADGELALSVDGGPVTKIVKTIPVGFTQMAVGTVGAGIQSLNGAVLGDAYFPTRLPDAQLQELAA